MIKCSIVQNNVIILNLYAPNKIASKYIKQIFLELHGEFNKSMVYSEEIVSSKDSVFGEKKTNYPIKWSIYLVALERINILAYFHIVAKYVREVAFIFPVCIQSAKR